MKLAYIILAHKLPEQLIRLVNTLNVYDPTIMIHIDRRTDPAIYQTIYDAFEQHKNVFFLKRHISKWGQMGCVQALLEGIKEIHEKGIAFDYLINLSGQDYPIKPIGQIHDILEKNNGQSYIRWNTIPYISHPHIDDWIRYYHVYFGKYHFAWPKENMISNDLIRKLWNPLAKKSNIIGNCRVI